MPATTPLAPSSPVIRHHPGTFATVRPAAAVGTATPAGPSPRTHGADTNLVGRAVGTLMATVPARADAAERILDTAAALAGLPEAVLAEALLDSVKGLPIPARVERALRQALRVAGTPAPSNTAGPHLLPLRAEAEKAVGRFFEARVRLAADPTGPEARSAFEDSLFTLCVLMGRPHPPEAVREAVQYTQT
ncbi:DUF5133 domain-containing protein [Streptomyces sp. NPDC054901]